MVSCLRISSSPFWHLVKTSARCLNVSSGFMLIGSDVKLNSPSSLIGQALAEILQYPDKARDALRVLLHLVRNAEHVYHEIDTDEALKI